MKLPSAERVTVDVDLTAFYLKGDEKSNPPLNAGDLVLDFCAGSGTTGAVALEQGRRLLLVDDNKAAISVMKARFVGQKVEFISAAKESA